MKSLLLLLALTACGTDPAPQPAPQPTPTPSPNPTPGGDVVWEDVEAIVKGNCGNCHNGLVHPLKIDSEVTFKTAKVKQRIENGSMPPPPRKLAVDDKKALLALFK
jgi:hypothetical protein